MLGAILGDIVGSPYEFDHNNYKHKDFPLLSEKSHFTDDTVMTAAVAVGLIDGKGLPESFVQCSMKCGSGAVNIPMPVTAGCSAGGCTQKIRIPMAVSVTARLCGCRQRAGCSIRWTKRWKWQK